MPGRRGRGETESPRVDRSPAAAYLPDKSGKPCYCRGVRRSSALTPSLEAEAPRKELSHVEVHDEPRERG